MSEFYKIKLIEKKNLTKNVCEFIFSIPHKGWSFLPGQYIEIKLPNVSPFPVREFTISSSPLEKNYFRVVTKMGESAFKKVLFNLKEGDTISMTYPKGGFVLDEKDSRERVFISGGLGITPFYSMIVYASQKKIALPITLFASFKNESDILFYDEFEKMYEEKNTIRVVYTVTSSKGLKNKIEQGRITKELLKKYVQNLDNRVFLIAGPNQMVDDMQDMLAEMQVLASNIHVEYFNGYELVD